MVVLVTEDKKIKDVVKYIAQGEDIVVTDNKGKFLGILQNDRAIRYLYRPETSLSKIIVKIKPLKGYDIVEIIEKLVNSNIRATFVKEDDKIEVINIFDVLRNILEDKKILEKLEIEEIMNPAYTIEEKESIKKAIGLMKDKGISRLIVVNEKGEAVGILSLSDILRYLLIENNERLRSPEGKDLDIEIRSVMSNKLIFVNKEENIENLIKLLIDNKIFSIPVLERGKPVGIITAKDMLVHYLQYKKEKEYNIIVHGIPLDEIDKKYIRKKYEEFYKRYKNILGENIRLILHVKKINEDIKNRKIYYEIKAKLISDKGKINVDDNGYDFYSTVKDIFEILANEAEKIKHKNEREYMLENIFKNDVIQYI
jgi:predicted transcriptional regulator